MSSIKIDISLIFSGERVKPTAFLLMNFFASPFPIYITGILFAVFFPFLPFTDRYFMDVAIMILTYIMLGWG